MIEDAYAQTAAACDRLLRAPDTSLARLAIPLLHFIDEHPAHLAQYAPLLPLDPDRPGPTAGSAARIALRIGRWMMRALKASAARPVTLHDEGPVDVVIVSRQVKPGSGPDDVYFGAMQSLLEERGATVARVLVNQLTVGPRQEARIWRQCFALRQELRWEARLAQSATGREVAMLASRHALSGVTAANLRLHAALAQTVAVLQPRIVITTYEGVAAERLIWHAARSSHRQPLCVGYQHTRMLNRAHAIRRSVSAPGLDCDPDVILTLGEIPQAALAASPQLSGVTLLTYGSHRRAAPSRAKIFGARPDACLVLPDGDDAECALLFGFAYQCARRLPDLRFTLRPHPVVTLTALRARHAWLAHPPPNVTLSAGEPLETACAAARYCLYRTSSAALHAVLAGVKPVYLARAGELSVDPLHALRDWHDTVATAEEFAACMEASRHSPDQNAALRAWHFCDRYVSRVRPEALGKLLSRQSARPSRPSSSATSAAK